MEADGWTNGQTCGCGHTVQMTLCSRVLTEQLFVSQLDKSWNKEEHCCVHKSPPLVFVSRQKNPGYIPKPCFSEIPVLLLNYKIFKQSVYIRRQNTELMPIYLFVH
jgi:hypothetical protein